MIEPGKPTIYNVVLTSADTEYSQALPANTRKLQIYATDSNKQFVHSDVLRIAFKSGTTSSDDIYPLPPGGVYNAENINIDQETVYFQSPTSGGYAVIIAWQ